MDADTRIRLVRSLERLCIVIGVALCIWVAAGWLRAERYQAHAEASLKAAESGDVALPAAAAAVTAAPPLAKGAPVGRLMIPRVGLSVMVAEGDDDRTLGLAAGHLSDTPFPWQPGNSAIAGHRDTFFRPLRQVKEGDRVTVETTHGTFQYEVLRLAIVNPDDVSVLSRSNQRWLTLVTCYPFQYIGNAPQRFIVQARMLPPTVKSD